MPTYNAWDMTNLTNMSGRNPLTALVGETSKALNYMPGLGVLIAIWFVFFFALKLRGSSTVDAALATSFMCSLIAILLVPLGAINPFIMITFVALTPIMILIKFMTGA